MIAWGKLLHWPLVLSRRTFARAFSKGESGGEKSFWLNRLVTFPSIVILVVFYFLFLLARSVLLVFQIIFEIFILYRVRHWFSGYHKLFQMWLISVNGLRSDEVDAATIILDRFVTSHYNIVFINSSNLNETFLIGIVLNHPTPPPPHPPLIDLLPFSQST